MRAPGGSLSIFRKRSTQPQSRSAATSDARRMAEREGFEPSVQGFIPVQRLSKPPLSATQPPLQVHGPSKSLAEGEGFEPPDPFGSTAFKTAAFDRSAT